MTKSFDFVIKTEIMVLKQIFIEAAVLNWMKTPEVKMKKSKKTEESIDEQICCAIMYIEIMF